MELTRANFFKAIAAAMGLAVFPKSINPSDTTARLRRLTNILGTLDRPHLIYGDKFYNEVLQDWVRGDWHKWNGQFSQYLEMRKASEELKALNSLYFRKRVEFNEKYGSKTFEWHAAQFDYDRSKIKKATL